MPVICTHTWLVNDGSTMIASVKNEQDQGDQGIVTIQALYPVVLINQINIDASLFSTL